MSVQVDPGGHGSQPGRDADLPRTGLESTTVALFAMTLILLAVLAHVLRRRLEGLRGNIA